MIEVVPIKKKLDCKVSIQGSKYIANRVLLIAALAKGASAVKNVPKNADIDATIAALKNFGVRIYEKGSSLQIFGSGGKLKAPKEEVYVRDSGTLMRFIAGFASLAGGKVKITGSRRIQERPINDLLGSLNDLGIKCSSPNGFPPVIINGGSLEGGLTKIKGDVSSQFISSLLLVSPYAKKDVEICVESELVSKSYIDMTLMLMKDFGVDVKNESYKKFKILAGQRYIPKNYTISADWSSANYFLAAAAIIPGRIKIGGLDLNEKGESGFVSILQKMGCKVNKNADGVEVLGNSSINAIEVDMSSMPDSVQTLAAVSVFANGTTRIKNVGNLKYKESDRLNDTAFELKKLGISAIAKKDELSIEGSDVKGIRPAIIDPHNDHRMAMSLALIGIKAAGIKIINPGCVAKSFPDFWEKLEGIGIKIKGLKNIVLMGYRGTGKTRTAEYMAKKLDREVISTDREIEKKIGPIRDYIKRHGWERFRTIESEVIKNISGNNLIIDSGGGFIEKKENVKNLKKNGIVIWLKAAPSIIRKRIKGDANRPSLTKKSFLDEIEEVLKKRYPLYKKAADHAVYTDNKSSSQVGEEIIRMIKNEL